MSGTERGRGARLRDFAERTFDRATIDRVILPALADLQHECATATGSAWSQRLTRWRAYWSVWKAIGVCLLHDTVRDSHGTQRRLGVRMLVFLPVLVALLLIPTCGWLISFGATHGVASAFTAGFLLAPATFLLALPAAFLFAVSLHRSTPEQPSPVPAVITGSIYCTAIVLLLLMVVVPWTNQAYRSFVFETFQRDTPDETRPLHLSKGLAEMTWRELNDQIAHPPSVRQGAVARAHRNERLAFVGVVPVLGLLGLALSNVWRSRAVTLTAALVVLIAYGLCFSLGADRYGQSSLYGPWTANGLFFVLAVRFLRARSARRLA